MKRKIWRFIVDANTYRVFTTGWDAKRGLEFDDVFKSFEKFGNSWLPIKLELWQGQHPKKEKKKSLADFMDSGMTVDAVSQRGKEILEPVVEEQVEFLALETPFTPYYGLHVNYVNCLDIESSKVLFFNDMKKVLRVVEYAFHWEKLDGIHIFRLPELGLSHLFVSDEFRQIVEENNLTGLIFYPVPLIDE